MSLELIFILVLILLLSIAVGYLIFLNLQNKKTDEDPQLKIMLEWMKDMKGSVEKTSETMEKKLKEQNEAMQNQAILQRSIRRNGRHQASKDRSQR